MVILSFAFAISAIAGDGDWVKVEPKMMGQQISTMTSVGGGGGGSISGKKITPPSVWFSYWGQTGSYNVQFYGENIEPAYEVFVYVDGIKKGKIIPQRTMQIKSNNSSAGLIDLKSLTGRVAIYEPGIHHIEVRVYISNKAYYSYGLYNLDVPYFEAGISMISADPNTVYIRYYLQPIFITISAGEPVNITIWDVYQNKLAAQTDEWGNYFVEMGIPLADYQNKMQNQQVPTTIEIQGYIKELQAYYWQPY